MLNRLSLNIYEIITIGFWSIVFSGIIILLIGVSSSNIKGIIMIMLILYIGIIILKNILMKKGIKKAILIGIYFLLGPIVFFLLAGSIFSIIFENSLFILIFASIGILIPYSIIITNAASFDNYDIIKIGLNISTGILTIGLMLIPLLSNTNNFITLIFILPTACNYISSSIIDLIKIRGVNKND